MVRTSCWYTSAARKNGSRRLSWSFLEPSDKGLDLGESVERNYIWHTLFVYIASCDLHRSVKHRLEQHDAIECALEAKPSRGR